MFTFKNQSCHHNKWFLWILNIILEHIRVIWYPLNKFVHQLDIPVNVNVILWFMKCPLGGATIDAHISAAFTVVQPFVMLHCQLCIVSTVRTINKINDDKTELLIITSPHSKFATDLQLSIGQCEITPTSKCKSLGVMLDDHFDMDAQIKNICRSAHFHLRNIRAIRPLLPDSAAAQLVHSLVTSRLDYCNSLLNGVPGYRIHPLQRVQNIAARIVSRCSRDIDSEDVLQSLNWLPIKYRITFKVLLIVYKCVNDLAPKYLSDLFIPYKKDRTVRNNFKHLLDCPENRDAKSKSYGHRAFGFAGADMWNTLPLDIKLSSSVSVFKSKLKTHLFKQCYGLTN